jgi:hypothetical protein
MGPSAKAKYAPRPSVLRMRLNRREVIIASEPLSRVCLELWKNETQGKGNFYLGSGVIIYFLIDDC